jgi:hypothetical protein
MCDYRLGLDWCFDLLTTLQHNSEIKVTTAPSLTSSLCKSLLQILSLLCLSVCLSTDVPTHLSPSLPPSCCHHFEHSASVKRFVSLQFLNLRQSVGLLYRGSARRKVATYTKQHKHTINVPAIPVFQRAKTFYALDRAATAIGICTIHT